MADQPDNVRWKADAASEAWLSGITLTNTDAVIQDDMRARRIFITSVIRKSRECNIKDPPLKPLELDADMPQIPAVKDAIWFTQFFDRVSMYLQDRLRIQLLQITTGALLFLVLFEFYAHLPLHFSRFENGFWPFLLVGILCLLFSANVERGGLAGRHRTRSSSRQTQMGYLDCRCISEMGRILTFWRLNGISDQITDLIPRACEQRLALVKSVVQEYEREVVIAVTPTEIAVKLTQKHWELDQILYYHRTHERQHLLSVFWKEVSSLAFTCGLIGVVGLIVSSVIGIDMESDAVQSMLTMVPSVIVFAAIVEFYVERKGFEPNVARYRHAEEIFRSDVIQAPRLADLLGAVPKTPNIYLLSTVTTLLCFAVLIWSVKMEASSVVLFGTLTALVPVATVAWYICQLKTLWKAREISDEQADNWAAGRQHSGGLEDWTKHMRSVGREAFGELVQWYISASDRIVTLPKG